MTDNSRATDTSGASLFLNELSLCGSPATASDACLARGLLAAFAAVFGRVATYDRPRLRIGWPDRATPTLPGGTHLAQALAGVPSADRDLGRLVLVMMNKGPWYEAGDHEAEHVTINGQQAHAGRAARLAAGMLLSVATSPWAVDAIAARWHAHGTTEEMTLLNVWRPTLEPAHLKALSAHYSVVPSYEDPGHHDPDGREYVAGKSHIPRAARLLLQSAVHDSGTWWTLCIHGFYHRFQPRYWSDQPWVHWNGTTNPAATQSIRGDDVPGSVRDKLKNLPAVEGCKCREV